MNKPTQRPPIDEPWGVPQSWTWSTIDEIADIVGGGTPNTDDARNFGGEIPWITPADLSGHNEKLIAQGERSLTHRGLDSSSAKLLPAGSVLFSTRAPIGYVAVAANELCTNQGFRSLVLADSLTPDYVYHYLKSAKDLVVASASGTTFLEISGTRLARIPVPIAPVREQNRIVEEIEKQFTRLDAGVAALKRVEANLRRYKAAVLKAAVEGRLTEKWRAEHPDVESASELLKRILTERRHRWEQSELAKLRAKGKPPTDDRWKKKYEEPIAPDADALPPLPNGWTWATAEQLSDETRAITYGVVKLGNPMDDGVPTLRSSNVRHLSLELGCVKRISARIADHYRRTYLQGGEILITVRGTLGGIVCCPEGCAGFNISREVAMLALVEPLVGPAIAVFIASTPIQGWLSRHTRGIAYTGVNIETLKRLPIPLAPIEELRSIVENVEDLLSVATAVRGTANTGRRRASRLRQSILKRAFEGKLVPQDPTDEPASALLDRIRSARNKASVHPARQRGRKTRKTGQKPDTAKMLQKGH